MVDIDKGELNKRRGLKPYLEVNEDCKFLLINYIKKLLRKSLVFQKKIIGTNIVINLDSNIQLYVNLSKKVKISLTHTFL